MKGWQYALDFPRTYHQKQSKTSCVRRRLWSRYYRFDGYDRWIKVRIKVILLGVSMAKKNNCPYHVDFVCVFNFGKLFCHLKLWKNVLLL